MRGRNQALGKGSSSAHCYSAHTSGYHTPSISFEPEAVTASGNLDNRCSACRHSSYKEEPSVLQFYRAIMRQTHSWRWQPFLLHKQVKMMTQWERKSTCLSTPEMLCQQPNSSVSCAALGLVLILSALITLRRTKKHYCDYSCRRYMFNRKSAKAGTCNEAVSARIGISSIIVPTALLLLMCGFYGAGSFTYTTVDKHLVPVYYQTDVADLLSSVVGILGSCFAMAVKYFSLWYLIVYNLQLALKLLLLCGDVETNPGPETAALLLSRNWEKLVTAMTFDLHIIAQDMNMMGLLSDDDYNLILKNILSSREKAEILMTSLQCKVDLNPESLITFVNILETKPVQYSDALQILQRYVKRTSDTDVTSSSSAMDPVFGNGRAKYAKILSRNLENLVTATTFHSYSTNWLAGEMNRLGLLSNTDFEHVKHKTLLSSREKAVILMASLKTKVDLNPEHLNTFVSILEMQPVQYSNALQLLQRGIKESSDPGSENRDGIAPLHHGGNYAIKEEKQTDEFMKDLEAAIAKFGTIVRKLANLVLIGPPNSGKSCLILRLTHKFPKDYSPSTGVCESSVIVDVGMEEEKQSSSLHSLHAKHVGNWTETDFDVSVVGQMQKDDIRIERDRSRHQKDDIRIERDRSPHRSHQSTKSTKPTWSTAARTTPSSSLMGRISAVINKVGFSAIKNSLTKSYSIYLTDTGGQVEFQEMIPLLISGPSIFFFVFRLDKDFKQRFEIAFRKVDGEKTNCYTSSISVKESLLQSLTSIAAISGDKKGVKTHPPMVFIIGTHKDNITKNIEYIADTDSYINAIVEKHGFDKLVQYADPKSKKLVFAVNNFSPDDMDFQDIRSRVNELVWNDDNFSVEYPISYLQCSLDLQSIEKSIISLDECQSLAEKYGIKNLKNFLMFLHLRLGIIRYFPIEGLEDVVFIKPQILFNIVTRLIVETFHSKLYRDEQTNFENKGIVTESVLKKVTGNIEGLKHEKFLQLLVHLRIASCLKREEEEEDEEDQYFLPCVLGHMEKNESPPSNSLVSPMFITFKCKYCPKGIYCVLINSLLTQNKGRWTLQRNTIYRDQVSFCVGEFFDTVTLKLSSSYMEVVVHPSRSKGISLFCNQVRAELKAYIESSITVLKYRISQVQHDFCFRCKYCLNVHKVNPDKFLVYCDTNQKWYEMEDASVHWFKSENISEAGGSDTSGELTIENLKSVYIMLYHTRSKWHEIGLELDVDFETLNVIEQDNSNIIRRFQAVLATWLNNGSSRTWKTLANAVGGNIVERPDIRKIIIEKYCM